jgi:drug/metabolite transporter (DMT)-like permease
MNPAIPAGAIALSAVLWGTWWWPMRLLDAQGLGVAWASLVIYVTAAAFLAPFAWARRRHLRAGGVVLVGVGGSLGTLLVLWNLAVVLGDVVRVTLLFYLTPVWATLLARFVLHEAVGRLRALAILAGLGGAAVVLGVPGETAVPLPRGAGDLLGLACGIIFAVSLTLARLGSRTTADGETQGLGGFEQSFAAFVFAGAGSALWVALDPAAGVPGEAVVTAMPLAAIVALAWLLPQTILVLWGAARFDPGRTAILMLLEVIAASVSATIVAGDVLSARDLAGCALILVAGALEAESLRRAPAAKTA